MNNKIKSFIVKQIVLAFKNPTKSIPPLMKVLLLFISLFLYDIASATTYFISASGNDATGNGTAGNPWKTLVKATQTLPIGTAYSVWTGIGAVGTVLVGILVFKEPANFLRLFFIITLIGFTVR